MDTLRYLLISALRDIDLDNYISSYYLKIKFQTQLKTQFQTQLKNKLKDKFNTEFNTEFNTAFDNQFFNLFSNSFNNIELTEENKKDLINKLIKAKEKNNELKESTNKLKELKESLQLTNSEISNSYFLMIKDPKTNKLTLYCLIEFKEEVIFKTLSIHKDNKLYFQKNKQEEVEIHEIEINIPLIGFENKKLDIYKYDTNANKYEPTEEEGFKTIANTNYNEEEYDIYFPSFFKKTNSSLKIENLIVTLTPNNNNSEYEVEKSYSFTKETENDNINQQEVINETCQLIAKNRIFGNTILQAKTKEERKDL